MTPSYMHPNIIYVEMEAAFSDAGFLRPIRFRYDRLYDISKVTGSSVVQEEEYAKLFPAPPEVRYHPVYKYEVILSGKKACIYFDRWPESGAMSLGRWFVVKKAP